MNTTLLVTGSSGYIAGHLLPALHDQGYTLVGVDREPASRPSLDRFVHGDLTDQATCREALDGVDAVVHLAAAKGDWGISKEEYYRDNLEATKVLLHTATREGVSDWVFYSTVSVYGPSHHAIDEEADFDPIHPYGASKADAERLYHEYHQAHPNARVLIVRPSVVYGPGNPASTNIYRLIDAIYNRRFVMVGPGDAIKSTSYIENLVAATLFLMRRIDDGLHPYVYVDEPALTTGELVARIYRLLGRQPPSWHVPLNVAQPVARISDVLASLTGIDFPITAARIAKFNRSTHFDASKIRDDGFTQPVSNADALRKTVQWHLDHEYDQTLAEPV